MTCAGNSVCALRLENLESNADLQEGQLGAQGVPSALGDSFLLHTPRPQPQVSLSRARGAQR